MPVGAVIKPPLSDCKYTKKIITSKYFPGIFQKNTENSITMPPIRGDESEILHFGKSLYRE